MSSHYILWVLSFRLAFAALAEKDNDGLRAGFKEMAVMQRVLEKMAQKLNEYDEASLMQLWQQYAAQVHEFEPSKRWEEAALALCLIQAVHWKNQLFNYHLALTANPAEKSPLPPLPDFLNSRREMPGSPVEAPVKARVLPFPGMKKRGPCLERPEDASGEGGETSPDGNGK